MQGALIKNKDGICRPIAGVIHVPGSGLLCCSDGEKIILEIKGVGKTPVIARNERILGYQRRVDPNSKVDAFYSLLAKKHKIPASTILSGGAGASVADLLQGKLNLIVMNYDYTKEWDVSFAEPILRALGGFVCDLSGNPFSYERRDRFNRDGYVMSATFRIGQVIPFIPKDLLIKKL